MDVYDQEPSIMAKQHSNSNDIGSEEEQQAKPSYTFDRLTYLHIDAALHIEYRLRPILKKCPNLKYFIGPSHDSCAYQANTISTYSINSSATRRTRIAIEFNDLLLWCPKLAYYVGDRSYYRDEYPTLVKKNSNTDKVLGRNNLYHLSINEQQYGYNQTAQILYQHKDTLEYLKLHRGFMSSFREDSHDVDNDDEETNTDWSYVFDHYQLSRLQTLICDHIHFNTASIINLLNSCSETIKTLDISMGPDDRQSQHNRTRLNNSILSFDYFVLQHMHTLTQLYTLRLTSVLFKDKTSVVIMLKQLPCLENLTIRASTFLLPESAAIFLKNLKHLELWALNPSQSEAPRQRQRQRSQNRNNSTINTINTRNGNNNNENIIDNEYEDYEKPGVIEPGVFQSLAFMDGSKLETIQISGISNVPSMHSLPFTIASLSTLKYLELKLNGSPLFCVSHDDGGIALLDFAIMLRENTKCIEHLTLNQVRCVSYHALEVLGGLPKLKILNIRLLHPKVP
ncbi:hypothetical protein INT45_013450 [Circinella minor]|uniref:Uncharacterized protein n=1 Tax=Circinella minor TaxID=1195481 RepID=A0A8H7S9L2_9FUNG|nr:hypothetical protein INT45_013450 [Circinella minor]